MSYDFFKRGRLYNCNGLDACLHATAMHEYAYFSFSVILEIAQSLSLRYFYVSLSGITENFALLNLSTASESER